MLQRRGAQPEQPVGPLGDDGGDAVVRDPGDPLGYDGIGPVVVERHRADDLDVDARVVHGREAPRGLGEQRPDPGELGLVDRGGLRAGAPQVELALSGEPRLARRGGLGRRDQGVGVHIDRRRHRNAPSATQPLRCMPRPVISASMTSPGRRQRVPSAVPLPAGAAGQQQVAGQQRGDLRAVRHEPRDVEDHVRVDSSCMTAPLSRRVIRRSIGSPTNSAGTRNGPVGRNVGAFFARNQSAPELARHVAAPHPVPGGDVVDDRVAGHVVERVLAAPPGGPAGRSRRPAPARSRSCWCRWGARRRRRARTSRTPRR